MQEIKLGKRIITNTSKPYVVVEIGHNHMGSVMYCKELIRQAALAGADAVKLQKRNNKKLFTEELYNQPYINKNSYGKTYGEHREYLEFNERQYINLIEYAKKEKITFFATPFDKDSLDFLDALDMPFYKIQSADISNLFFIEQICEKGKPIIMSTGGASIDEITRAAVMINGPNYGNPLAILHCIARYPAKAQDINLKIIPFFRKKFYDNIVGFSSHYDGILASIAAYSIGAQIIEQHFTLHHTNKGSDHAMSLQPAGLQELIHYLNELYLMRGDDNKSQEQVMAERDSIRKLGKSMYFKRDIEKGEEITWHDINIKSPANVYGLPISTMYGRFSGNIKTTQKHKKDELLTLMNL